VPALEARLSAYSFDDESEFFVAAACCKIVAKHFKLDAMQAEVQDGMVDEAAHRLGAKTSSPVGDVTNHDADDTVAILPVDAVQTTNPHQPWILVRRRLGFDGENQLRRGLEKAVEPALFFGQRQRLRTSDVGTNLGIVEPPDDADEVGALQRAKPDSVTQEHESPGGRNDDARSSTPLRLGPCAAQNKGPSTPRGSPFDVVVQGAGPRSELPMPRRTDLKTICVLGSGPIVIGQAAEFDYSGAQAVKALKDQGYRVVLINSNPATIMTDPELADATYIEPLVPDVVARILEKERPDALLPTVGGQTALNLAMALDKDGTLARLSVELIGAKADVIDKAENRQRFKACMEEIGLENARSFICHSMDEAKAAQQKLGLPTVIRPSFTMGGTGGGIARTLAEFEAIAAYGLDASPTTEILVEESLLGWKELELEVVRDQNDNCIIVCGIENFDPMGVHTGDSITVAPIQTLSDREVQKLRDAAIAILRAVGVETGGSNVQFALNPKDGRVVVVEMNPRVSRSSALASKATGFPIAKVAALCAVGLTLDEIENDITGKTKAAFEPSIDYVIVKHPRFDFEKFKGAERKLTTQMKSVGEAMSIGRTFQEAMGKALRSLELGVAGLEIEGIQKSGGAAVDENAGLQGLLERMTVPCPERPWLLAEAFRRGATLDEVHDRTGIDLWFLHNVADVVACEQALADKGSLSALSSSDFWGAKQRGLADQRIAQLVGATADEVRACRKALGVTPVMKRVDTCAGEFAAQTPYLYSTYERPFLIEKDGVDVEVRACEAEPTTRKKVLILGGGPIRIGQGIEFDYCCVHAAWALRAAGFEAIMLNCNPETVSTDYDTSDRLYFEPLTLEEVLNVCDREKPWGIIVQFGGQTPLKLSRGLLAHGQHVLGTSPDSIDRAEDRKRSAELVDKLGLLQPPGGTATSKEACEALAQKLGFPVLLRPSYVLGGRAMELVHDIDGLRRYLDRAVMASESRPILVDRFLDGAIEVDVDVLCDGTRVVIGAVMEHIEEAGIHSGDSACVLPPHTLDVSVVEDIERIASALALELQVKGLMNAQFAVRRNRVFVIEVNPRASRTVPFASKATGLPLARLAARIQAGESLNDIERSLGRPLDRAMTRAGIGHYAVKEAVLPFIKFPGVDVLLGPEMRSTGEVMGIDDDDDVAFGKSQLGAGTRLPVTGTLFVSVADVDKEAILPAVRRLEECGFRILATGGTHRFLQGQGLTSVRVNKVREGSPHILEELAAGRVDLVLNTTVGALSVSDSYSLRREALVRGVAYFTTVAAADAAARAIERLKKGAPSVSSLQERLAR
jgi:carbamoyl-phosphate synthase large subunit